MKRFATLSLVAAAPSLVTGLAGAADQTILGRSLLVKNPGDPAKRTIASSAKESASPNTITGNPTLAGSAGGAMLTVIANGANPATQTFSRRPARPHQGLLLAQQGVPRRADRSARLTRPHRAARWTREASGG